MRPEGRITDELWGIGSRGLRCGVMPKNDGSVSCVGANLFHTVFGAAFIHRYADLTDLNDSTTRKGGVQDSRWLQGTVFVLVYIVDRHSSDGV